MVSSGFCHFLPFQLNPRIPESLTPQAHTNVFVENAQINHPESAGTAKTFHQKRHAMIKDDAFLCVHSHEPIAKLALR
jgi:hypothetical protein